MTNLSTNLTLLKPSQIRVRPLRCSPGILRFETTGEVDRIELIVDEFTDIPG